MPASAVPLIDISPLLEPGHAKAAAVARQVAETAEGIGFMVVTGLDLDVRLDGPTAKCLLAFFDLPAAEKLKIARKKFVPENPWVYRGYFPADPAAPSYKEGLDIGVHAAGWPPSQDPLCETTPLPAERLLPGFAAAMAEWIAAMERLGNALLRVLATNAGLDADFYAREFTSGASTLRLLHYPVRPLPADDYRSRLHGGVRRGVGTGEHTDSGGLTLLVQDMVGGLQVQDMDGRTWHDVPPVAGGIVVNLGDLMQLWSGGRYRATPHRVLQNEDRPTDRTSIPYFYEPRYQARILTPDGAAFTYREHLVRKMVGFTEYKGVIY